MIIFNQNGDGLYNYDTSKEKKMATTNYAVKTVAANLEGHTKHQIERPNMLAE